MDTDTDIGELDGHNYPHLKLKASKLVHQSFPEVNSLAPNPLQPLYHLLPLNLVKINHFTITSLNAILPNTQSITSSLSDMKTSNYKGWQKGFVQQGLI